MPNIIERVIGILKDQDLIGHALRYNPLYYRQARCMLREVDGMDRADRRELSERLTARTLRNAARLPGGRPASLALHRHPITEKQELRDYPQRFQAPGLVRIAAATSGSTGIPVRLTRSLRNISVEQAFIDHQMADWGFCFKDSRVARMRADAFKRQDDQAPPYGTYRSRRHLLLSANHVHRDTATWFHDELRRFAPDLLFAHPSSSEALAVALHLNGCALSIPVVLTSSETLHPAGRRLLEQVFNATVVDYYGMSERLLFATSRAAGAYFINPAYGRVELFEAAGAEAPPGCRALDVVATGFWNDAMPLVRYRSDDRMIVPEHYGTQDLEDVCLGLKPLISVEGRDREYVIAPDGRVIIGLNTVTHGIAGLLRMQVVQITRSRCIVRVVVDARVGIDEDRLMGNIYKWAPPSMHFELQVADRVEHLPSGKTPVVIRRI